MFIYIKSEFDYPQFHIIRYATLNSFQSLFFNILFIKKT
jgi:hypothetical protein